MPWEYDAKVPDQKLMSFCFADISAAYSVQVTICRFGSLRNINSHFLLSWLSGHWWTQPQSPSTYLYIRSLRQPQLIWRWQWKTWPWSLHLRVGINRLEGQPRFSASQPPFSFPPSRPSFSTLANRTTAWTFSVRMKKLTEVHTLLYTLFIYKHQICVYPVNTGTVTGTVVSLVPESWMNSWFPHPWNRSEGFPLQFLPSSSLKPAFIQRLSDGHRAAGADCRLH